jgi:tetratricopeptide (TPR) repeat protein
MIKQYYIIFIYLFFIVIFVEMIVIPKVRENKLSNLLKVDPLNFIKTVDKYYKHSVDPIWKNCVKVIKIRGLYKCQMTDDLFKEIHTINIKKLYTKYLSKYLNDILLFYLIGETEIAKEMIKNIGSIDNEKILKSSIFSLIKAVTDYTDGKYSDAETLLTQLFEKYQNNHHITYVYYYMGMIYLNRSDKEKSREYFEKSFTYKNRTMASEKSLEMLNSMEIW